MSRYGVGYHLTLVKRERCDQDTVTNLVKHHVPTAEIVSSVGAELQFVLSSEHAQQFEILFSELESKSLLHVHAPSLFAIPAVRVKAVTLVNACRHACMVVM